MGGIAYQVCGAVSGPLRIEKGITIDGEYERLAEQEASGIDYAAPEEQGRGAAIEGEDLPPPAGLPD
ncbi:hypothetical protein HOU22_gp56 [Escherichia phage C130_2]|uniref:Uncharacterized protein n=1 Tax=Escherichia phage C130_2 TaxID=2234093 RepID=A0A384ZRQ4_9CAUD|nr:hypothetical protein HOU22_gp56 [Escherichia phage C130_2]AXC34325.1 hypothetical protein 1302_0015 [Escherichia phage C130_2]